MLHFRLLAIIAATATLLAGCGKDEAPEPVAPSANALLRFVPADAPYLSASLQPVPEDIIDRYLQRAEPMLQAMQSGLSEARAQLEADPAADVRTTRFALALVQELDGKLNRAGLESLGFDLSAPQAFYGLGAFPVLRMGLSDAAALRATVERVLANAGVQAPELERQGQGYWQVPMRGRDGAAPAGALYVAILDDHLAIGVFPVVAEDEMLAHLLGQAVPPAADAADRLQAINQRYGYTPYGTAEFDLLRLAEEFMSTDSRTLRALRSIGIDLGADLSEVCRAEIRGIIDQAPRVVTGLTELTADSLGYEMVVETRPALAGELTALVAPVPPADPDTTRPLEFAVGLKVGALRDFLRARALAVTESPYRCEHLLDLNEGAAKAYGQLNQPIPPLVNNFQGLRLSLSRVGSDPRDVQSVQGVAAVHVDQPEMFVGMAQMFLPQLAELQLVKGGPPVQLPPSLVPMPGVTAFAALGDAAIGLALGETEQARLVDYLDEEAGPEGTFLSVNYDTSMYLEYTDQFSDAMAALEDEGETPPAALAEIGQAAQEVYKAMAGRTDTRLEFTEDGFVIGSRMTFQ